MCTHGICSILIAVFLLAGVASARAEDASPPPWPGSGDDVLSALRRTLAWYQQSRLAMQSANDAVSGVVAREDEQTTLHAVQRAFDVARAKATLLERSDATAASAVAVSPRAARRAKSEATVRDDERELERLRALVRTAPRGRRAAIERDIVTVTRRLELDRLRLEFVTSLEQADASLEADDLDLTQQIQALRDAVPELGGAKTEKTVVATAPPSTAGAWPVIHRLFALQRSRGTLDQLEQKTTTLAREVDEDLKHAQAAVRSLAGELRALASNPADADAEFRARLERVKLLAAPVVPLRAESALLHRLTTDIAGWQRSLERETRQVIEELGLQLVGVALALVIVFVGAIVWRVVAMRYISDPYRRRLALTVRNFVVAIAIVLILIFRFTTELTALVTALGFAAAGIAFALQNVILAVAGYFSMVAPNGIRVGDRVSLQGPFGYVHGEVLEIGFVRIRLRELAGDSLQPTGRIVVFPNSVVFTGSFYKLPPTPHVKAA